MSADPISINYRLNTGLSRGFSVGSTASQKTGDSAQAYVSDRREDVIAPSADKRKDDSKRRFDSFECKTCENRRYQDGSDDAGVSCQTPTKFSPETAAARVRGHEQEHVVRNQAKAEREGSEIVSQTVTLHTGICPECGKVYISGGTTETTIRKGSDKSGLFNVGTEQNSKGQLLDTAV
ncbi:MAG: hypothetical protein ACI4KA_08760 [Oscillospiraceae bacterium]